MRTVENGGRFSRTICSCPRTEENNNKVKHKNVCKKRGRQLLISKMLLLKVGSDWRVSWSNIWVWFWNSCLEREIMEMILFYVYSYTVFDIHFICSFLKICFLVYTFMATIESVECKIISLNVLKCYSVSVALFYEFL